jgi:hypothetical protein
MTEGDLGTELLRVQNHTLEDGRVRGEVVEIDDSGDMIDLEIRVLSTRETFTTSFDKPRTWTRKNRFVRLVEYCGYNSASALQIEGDKIPLTEDGDDWVIDFERLPGDGVIEQSDYYYGAFRGFVAGVFLLAGWYGLLRIVQMIRTEFLDGVGNPPLLFGIIGGGVILFLWIGGKFIKRPVDDDKDSVSITEMQTEDAQRNKTTSFYGGSDE